MNVSSPGAGERGRLLEVGLGACRGLAVDDVLGCAPAEQPHDPPSQVALAVAVAVGFGALERDAERAATGDDRDLAHGVRSGLEHSQQRVPGFVEGGAPALVG